MIYTNKYTLAELKYHILKDFKDVVPDIEKDYKETEEFNVDFTVWIENGQLIGYMGIIYFDDLIFCSYTKAHKKKVIRKMYNLLKEIYDNTDLPVITDGTNFRHCAHHVKPWKDTPFFQWCL